MPPSLPSKKRKTRETDDTVRTVQDLEKQLTSAVSNGSSLNPLADLLDIALATENPAHLSKAIYALYRVFVVVITNGLLSGPDRTEEAKAVRAWLLERLHTFVDFLASLMKDEELTLRVRNSCCSFRPLQLTCRADVFSRHLVLAPKAPLFIPDTHRGQQATSTVPRLALPQNCVRTAALPTLATCCRVQEAEDRRKVSRRPHARPRRARPLRQHLVQRTRRRPVVLPPRCSVRRLPLSKHASPLTQSVFRLLVSKHPYSEAPQLPGNLLSILERLTTFPTKASELNSWWVEEMGTKPPPPKKSKGGDEDADEDDAASGAAAADEEDDWRKFFDEPSAKPAAEGKKGPAARVHTLTIHQSLHSLAAHRAVFTRAWLTLLPQLSLGASESTKAYSLRVLNVLHRGVIPHLTRPILIMDWVSSSVDHGTQLRLRCLTHSPNLTNL